MKNTNKITLCAIMSALATVIMLVSYFPYLTYAVPAVAGLCIMAVVIEINLKWAFFSYIISSVLVFMFAETESKLLYIFLFGYYPIIKSLIEKIGNQIIEWILKLLNFNISVVLAYFILTKLFMLPLGDFGPLAQYGVIILLGLGNIVFVVYDIAVSRMSQFYYYKLHSKVKKIFKN